MRVADSVIKCNDVLHEYFVGCLVVEFLSGSVVKLKLTVLNLLSSQVTKISFIEEVLAS